MSALAAGLRGNRTLKKFTLVNNRINSKELCILLDALTGNDTIIEFNIWDGRSLSAVSPCPLLYYYGSTELTELSALIQRNKEKVFATFPVFMAEGKAFQVSGRWKEAAAAFEKIINNGSVIGFGDKAARDICNEANERRKFCSEMLEGNAGVAAGAIATAAGVGAGPFDPGIGDRAGGDILTTGGGKAITTQRRSFMLPLALALTTKSSADSLNLSELTSLPLHLLDLSHLESSSPESALMKMLVNDEKQAIADFDRVSAERNMRALYFIDKKGNSLLHYAVIFGRNAMVDRAIS